MKEQIVLKNINDFENKSLLIVDDDNPFRERLARAMEKKGFEVTQAESVQKGIEYVKAKKPGFAVVDLRLGDGNGLEVVKEIQNTNSESRIIMLTGYGNIPTAVAAVKHGAIDYLAKPADADDVEKALLADPRGTLFEPWSIINFLAEFRAWTSIESPMAVPAAWASK